METNTPLTNESEKTTTNTHPLALVGKPSSASAKQKVVCNCQSHEGDFLSLLWVMNCCLGICH